MSTTVSYKGNTIATINNTTKTLTTEGTWLEDDITITDVTASPSLQSKTNINPTTSSQTITADAGYDGLSSVQINAMPSGSATTPATTITANPSITVSSGGLITATASATQSVTPTVSAGYVSSGTAGTITVSGSNTSQMTTKGATTYTPTTADQTIASGTYLTGTQTIEGDADLVAGNIKDGVTIFGVTGTYTGGGSSTHTVTIARGVTGGCYIKLNNTGTSYRTTGDTITFSSGDTLYCYASGTIGGGTIKVDDVTVASSPDPVSYTYTLPQKDILVYMTYGTGGEIDIYTDNYQIKTNIHPSSSSQTITADAGYDALRSVQINGVTTTNLLASNIKSGVTVEIGDSTDSDCVTSVTGTYNPGGGGGGGNVQANVTVSKSIYTTSYTDTEVSLTVATSGTYNIYWSGYRSSSSGTNGTRIYVNGTAIGTAHTTWGGTNTITSLQACSETNITLNAGDVVSVYARARSTSYYVVVTNLVIAQTG